MYELVVVEPFGEFSKGQRITDQASIDKALAENADCVIRVHAQPKAPKSKKAASE